MRPFVACLPAWFRFAQCLRRYRDTKEAFPHLLNAIKYATSFFVVIFSYLHLTNKSKSFAFSNIKMLRILSKLILFLQNTTRCLLRIPTSTCG